MKTVKVFIEVPLTTMVEVVATLNEKTGEARVIEAVISEGPTVSARDIYTKAALRLDSATAREWWPEEDD